LFELLILVEHGERELDEQRKERTRRTAAEKFGMVRHHGGKLDLSLR
jgi:hypothetical protein